LIISNFLFYKLNNLKGLVLAINRTSDSLSRCDPGAYSHLYDVTRKALLKPDQIHAPASVSKDTIEISRHQLKKEALNRLRHKSKFTILQVGFIRIGKYLFVALAFPPYLLVVGLPKWVFGNLILPLMSWMKQSTVKLKQKVKKPITRIFQKILYKLQQSRLFVQRLMRPLIHSIYTFNTRLKNFFKLVKNPLQLLPKMPHLDFSTLNKRLAATQKKLAFYQEKIGSQLKITLNHIKQLPEWLETILKPQWLQAASQLGTQLKTNQQKSYQQAQQKVAQVGRALTQVFQGIKQPFSFINQQVKNFIRPLLQSLYSKLRQKGAQAKEFSQKRQQQASDFFNRQQEKLKNISYVSLINRLLISRSIRWFSLDFQQRLKKWLVQPFMLKLGQAIVKIYVRTVKNIFKTAYYLMNQSFQLGMLVAQQSKKIIQNVPKTYHKVVQLKTSGYQVVADFIFKKIYQLSVWIFMLGILTDRGFWLLIEWSKELDRRLTFLSKPQKSVQ
jgi:hypothetical protein